MVPDSRRWPKQATTVCEEAGKTLIDLDTRSFSKTGSVDVMTGLSKSYRTVTNRGGIHWRLFCEDSGADWVNAQLHKKRSVSMSTWDRNDLGLYWSFVLKTSLRWKGVNQHCRQTRDNSLITWFSLTDKSLTSFLRESFSSSWSPTSDPPDSSSCATSWRCWGVTSTDVVWLLLLPTDIKKVRKQTKFTSENFGLKKDFFEGARSKIESFDIISDSKGMSFRTLYCNKVSDRVKQRVWSETYQFRITRDESSSAIVSSTEGKRTERFPEKSSRYGDSLKSEVRL